MKNVTESNHRLHALQVGAEFGEFLLELTARFAQSAEGDTDRKLAVSFLLGDFTTEEDRLQFVAEVHQWLMDHMEKGERIRGYGHDSANRRTPLAPAQYTFHRGGHFVAGMIEYGDYLYEFLPGRVFRYARLPVHLAVTPPALPTTPYTVPSNRYLYSTQHTALTALYVLGHRRGWANVMQHRTGTSEGVRDLPEMMGGALREVEKYFYRRCRTAFHAEPESVSRYLPLAESYALRRALASSQREALVSYYSKYLSFTPVKLQVVAVWDWVDKEFDPDSDLETMLETYRQKMDMVFQELVR